MKLHIAVAQIRPKKADYSENLKRIGAVLATVSKWETVPDLVVFPESVVSGYDLQGGTRESAVTAGGLVDDLAAIHVSVGAPAMDVVVGFYEEFRNRLYNSAVYANLCDGIGSVCHVHRKVFLPTYGPFDEARFLNHGHSVQAFDTDWGRAAINICEDVWHSIMSTLAALDGAQLLIVPSAPPARGINPSKTGDDRPQSIARWERIAQQIAAEHGIYVVLANLVGFDGGKALQGGSCVTDPDGEIIASAPPFEDAILSAQVDLEAITRVRANNTMLADLETQLPDLLRPLDEESEAVEYDSGSTDVQVPVELNPAPISVVHQDSEQNPLAIDVELVERWLVTFL